MEDMVLQRKIVRQTNWMKYRALFPHIDNMVYLNHAALAPMHNNSLRAIQQCYYERSCGDIEFWPATLNVKSEFKKLVGQLINAAPENIAVTDSTSMGLNWLAQGLIRQSLVI